MRAKLQKRAIKCLILLSNRKCNRNRYISVTNIYKTFAPLFIIVLCAMITFSCSSTKHVADGDYLLASVSIKSDTKDINTMELHSYVKQKANFKTFEIFKFPLFVYNLSGNDTTKWYNRALRSGGEPPVIYDSTQVDRSVLELKTIVSNKGYVDAQVEPIIKKNKKKVSITYNIKAGEPYIIDSYGISIPDSVFMDEIYTNSNQTFPKGYTSDNDSSLAITNVLLDKTLVKPKSIFDLDLLDSERARVSSIFRRTGFYHFNKEYVNFIADTTLNNKKVGLELSILPFTIRQNNQNVIAQPHKQYTVENVIIYVDIDPLVDGNIQQYEATSVVSGNGYAIIYGKREQYIKPSIVLNNCYILPGVLFNEDMVNLTYNSFSQLKILRNVNISFIETDSLTMDCIITCMPDKKQGISADIEGTNSAGFLGVGAGLGYIHRNLFKGSEQFSVKLNGSYEAVTPSFSNFNDNYFELKGETSLTFPRFINPFLTSGLKRRFHASTQLATNYSFQRRPGAFTRTILSGGIKYIWNEKRNSSVRHSLDLLDLSYVHLPRVEQDFLESLTDEARIYSFQDQFIASAGYSYYNSNFNPLVKNNADIKTIRATIESAGNALALIAKLIDVKPDDNNVKKIFNTAYSQYIRGSIDYSRTYRIDEKNSIAWRLGGGLVYPYGNSRMVPIQKRFFSGGANSVRGWGIRELGPGAYYSPESNFYYHSGDIRFDANIEYRSKAFWIIEFAAFIDGGNIWTIREYEKQEKGSFKFDTFYKQIAASWGLGIRFDFDFVLVRLDCGWKMYDPAERYSIDADGNTIYESNRSHWPVLNPLNFGKNTAWHIAIGYPF